LFCSKNEKQKIKTYLHTINVFIISGQFLFFLSIELDVVMEADNELEEKDKLGTVRFSIRNCKTEAMSSDMCIFTIPELVVPIMIS
jgi:hypothetical protein